MKIIYGTCKFCIQNAPIIKQVLILLLLLINYQHSHVLYNLGDNMNAKISYRIHANNYHI